MGTGLACGGVRVRCARSRADHHRRGDSGPRPDDVPRPAGRARRMQLRAGRNGDVRKHALLAGSLRVQPDLGVEAGRAAHDRDAARRLHDQVQPTRLRRTGGGYRFPDIRGCVPREQRPLHRRFRSAGAEPDDSRHHTTATLDGITVTGPGGVPESGYAFVGADAESTDRKESITWTSNTPLTLLEPVGNACNSGSGLTGIGTKTVTCLASVSNTKTGTAMLAAQAPSSIAQEMVGGGHQGIAFGVLVSTVQINKVVTSRIDPSDAFGVSIHSLPTNDLLGSANTGTANTASTGPITVLTSDVGSSFTFAEQITSGLPSNYTGAWSCTRNGVSDPELPSGDIGSSAAITLGIGDFVDCTITNTSEPVSIAL